MDRGRYTHMQTHDLLPDTDGVIFCNKIHDEASTIKCFEGFLRNPPGFTLLVPTGSPSRGEDVAVYVFNINQPSLPTLFYSVLVSLSVFMAPSTVF